MTIVLSEVLLQFFSTINLQENQWIIAKLLSLPKRNNIKLIELFHLAYHIAISNLFKCL